MTAVRRADEDQVLLSINEDPRLASRDRAHAGQGCPAVRVLHVTSWALVTASNPPAPRARGAGGLHAIASSYSTKV
jgi:hypothetical protein